MATGSPGALLVQAAPERSSSDRIAFLEPRNHRVEVRAPASLDLDELAPGYADEPAEGVQGGAGGGRTMC